MYSMPGPWFALMESRTLKHIPYVFIEIAAICLRADLSLGAVFCYFPEKLVVG